MHLPDTSSSLVLRTDFSDGAAWDQVCTAIRKPVGEFRAYVECVSDSAFEGFSLEEILALASESSYRTFLFIVDRVTIADPEHPVLVVDLIEQPGRTFRVVPGEMWAVENNLSIANMDFAEFAEAVDETGVFRGFSRG